MPNQTPRLNRAQLAEFLKDPRAIKAFEELFTATSSTIPDTVESAQFAGDSFQTQISEVASALLELAAVILTQPALIANTNNSLDYETLNNEGLQQDVYIPPVTNDTENRNSKFLVNSVVPLQNFAAAAAATLNNAPAVGNPTKWIAINDNGTTRYIPTW
jgi:hypothetical protein